ncbi:MAG: SWIM zinc finger family protein [Chloroflexota bacterium]
MHSSVIGKIEKAHRYAQEPERIAIARLEAAFRGDNDAYSVTLGIDGWSCTCHSFHSLHGCAHILALQELLGRMLPEHARTSDLFAPVAVAAG